LNHIDLLTKKFDDYNIEYNIDVGLIKDEHSSIKAGIDLTKRYVSFSIGRGRENEKIRLWDRSSYLEDIVNSNFLEYKLIKGYEAIWSNEGIVECELSYMGPPARLLKRIQDLLEAEAIEKPENGETLSLDEDLEGLLDDEQTEEIKQVELFKVKGIVVKIGKASKEYCVMKIIRMGGRGISTSRIMDRTYTLKFENCSISTHDEALNILSKLGLGIQLLLNEKNSLELNLEVEKKYGSIRRERGRFDLESNRISAPKYEYDIEPLSLYLHARSRGSLPLYSYLAFYQVLEYYFPKYSEIKVKNDLKRTLKDPKFNLDNDGHLDEVLKLIKFNKSNEYNDELTQLKSVIDGCINLSEIEDLLINDEYKLYFKRSKYKLVSSKKISINPNNTELVNQIASRIYDIRCNIVHKKSSFSGNGALPHTISYIDIMSDIKLVQLFAYKALIANSKLLNI